MIMDDDLFKQELSKINGVTSNPVNWDYAAEFIDENNNILSVLNVLSLDIVSNYTSAVADHIFISLQISKDIYFKLLNTNRRLLQLKFTRNQVAVTGSTIKDNKSYSYIYNAYLLDNTSEAVETRVGKLEGSQRDLLGELQEIHVQLVEKGLSEFRLWDCGGVYKNTSTGDIIKGLLSQPIQSLGESGNDHYHVTMYEPDNKDKRYQRLIPNGVRLINLPRWIQEKWGVYSTGIGYYLSQGMWYIYPLYNIMRYDTEVKRMTIINVPKNEMMSNSNSYVQIGNELYVYATGDTKHLDNADRHLDSSGTGFRTAKAGNLLDRFTDSKNGETSIAKDQNNIVVSFDNRDGLVNNLKTDKLFTSNVYEDASNVIKGMCNIVIVNWEYSNPYLLYPGMPIKLLYKYMGKPYALRGVLAETKTSISTPMKSVTDKRYVSLTQLVLTVERVTQ